MKSKPKVLLFSPSVAGGIAEHTLYQAQALKKVGARVICLVAPSFLGGRKTDFEKIVCLPGPVPTQGSRLVRRIRITWLIMTSQLELAWQIVKYRPDLVLLDSYVEYLAPLWVWPHWLLARLAGVKYAANLHDPVRNYVFGPKWWHWLSVRLAYLPLDFVLVHGKLPEPSPVPAKVRTVQVPHGLYEIAGPAQNPVAIRREWGAKNGQKVFLCFGAVRDGKNLDLVARALPSVRDAFLVIAGSVGSAKDRPFTFYRQLAADLDVAERCRFFEGFVADADIGKYFWAADFVLLTYASSFHSQSGVLNLAASAHKPVLASASPSALIEAVRDFNLGITVAPDSLDAIVDGMQRLMESPPKPRWQEYEAVATWEANARGVLQAAGLAEH